jgi:hypothetical protein
LLALGALVGVALAQGTRNEPADTTMTHDGSRTDKQPLGSDRMPFDIERSTHVFRRLHDGGVQLVATDNPADVEQVHLIRSHLRRERHRFSHGNFADPTAIHGHDMPGLAALKRGYRRVKVTYRPRRAGAALRYRTKRRRMVKALHEWFAAQVHDHAPYAELR